MNQKAGSCITIAICGRDCIGKSTQVGRIAKQLRYLQSNVEVVRLPYLGFCYKLIRKMLGNGTAIKFPNFFQFIQTLNKLTFQLTKLNKIKSENDFIIMDRCFLSTLTYGNCSGASEWFTNLMCHFLTKPDVIFLLDGEQFLRDTTDSYDLDHGLQTRLRNSYLSYAVDLPVPTFLIEANNSEDVVTDDIMTALHMFMNSKK
jgi:thymidylate kinase